MRTLKLIQMGCIGLLFAFAGGCGTRGEILWSKLTLDTDPTPREFKIPERTTWKPVGEREILPTSGLSPKRGLWNQRHGTMMNTDEVTVTVAPMNELDWISDVRYFHLTAIGFDQQGNLYAGPAWPYDNSAMVRINPETGKTDWKIKGTGIQSLGDVPIILNDPDRSGRQIVYTAKRHEIVAADSTDGAIVFRKPSGLSRPPDTINRENLDQFINWGPNYNPRMDALVSVTGDGIIWAVDRKTGDPVMEPFSLPGATAVLQEKRELPEAIQEIWKKELVPLIGGAPEGVQLADLIDFVLGERVEIANYFSIIPETGSMWFSGTAADEADGKKDGFSEYGATYRIDVVSTENGRYPFKLVESCHLTFKGGSATTTSMRVHGRRGYVADAHAGLIAFNDDCSVAWKFQVGQERGEDQIVGSPTVSSDNGELYVITRREVIKLVDLGETVAEKWRAVFDQYGDINQNQWNLVTAALASNGLAVEIGVGPAFNFSKEKNNTKTFTPVKIGVGVLDRETGRLRSYTEGKEDSTAVTTIGPDGGIYLPHSPVRRIFARAIFKDDVYPLGGGIARFRPRRIDIMLRDITCSASDRAARALSIQTTQPAGTRADFEDIMELIDQARTVAPRGINAGDIKPSEWAAINESLVTIERMHEQWRVSGDAGLAVEMKARLDGVCRQTDAPHPWK